MVHDRTTGAVQPEIKFTARDHGCPLLMPVWAVLPNSGSDNGVAHGDLGDGVRRDELATRDWLVGTVASRIGVEAVILVGLVMVCCFYSNLLLYNFAGGYA